MRKCLGITLYMGFLEVKTTLYMGFLALLMTLFIGCGAKGPAITDCTPRAANFDFKCFNEANGKASNVPASKLDNWIFVSAADERSILTACQKKMGWPKIKVCSFSAAQMKYVCFDEVSQSTSIVLFANSEGMIGVSPVDEQILLEFCSTR